jgi:hypothetical protein
MDHENERQVSYDAQPDYAIAALLQMLVRYPMTWCGHLGESIEAHFEYIARDERYSRPVREAASRAGGEWKAMLLMQEQIRRQQRRGR